MKIIALALVLVAVTIASLTYYLSRYEWRCTDTVEVAVIHSMERVSKRGRSLIISTTDGRRIEYETTDGVSVGEKLCMKHVKELRAPEPAPDRRLKYDPRNPNAQQEK